MLPCFGRLRLPRAAAVAQAIAVCLLVLPRNAVAQDPSGQLWGDLEVVFPQRSEDWLFDAGLKPEVQFSGDEKWAKLELGGRVAWRAPKRFDLTGDAFVSYAVQNDDLETLELVPRVGVTLHLLSDVRDVPSAGHLAKRVGLATTVRLENRQFWYFGSGATQSHSDDWRLRFRLETRIGINHPDRSLPGTWSAYADAEAFVTLGESNQETYAEEWRIRFGPALRLTTGWRFEVLYVRDLTRNTIESDYSTSVNALELSATHFLGVGGGA